MALMSPGVTPLIIVRVTGLIKVPLTTLLIVALKSRIKLIICISIAEVQMISEPRVVGIRVHVGVPTTTSTTLHKIYIVKPTNNIGALICDVPQVSTMPTHWHLYPTSGVFSTVLTTA